VTIRLAGVFAHPDDDVYLLGGTLLLGKGEIEPSLLFATDGGAGPISDPSQATRETLGSVRKGEQRDAMRVLGYPDTHVRYLGHPDYYLPNVPLQHLISDVEAFLADVMPHIVVTFGPDGLTSHHDHVHIGAAATEAFRRMRAGGHSDGFQRLYHAVHARSDIDRFYAGVREGSFEYGKEGNLFDLTGVPDESITVRVDTTSVRDRKYEGILAHKTQMIEHERVPEPLRWIYLDAECFVQVVPAPEPGVRASLIQDLAAAGRS
jgi:LmbE family N-acetylglucosaminyl deacetylase